MRRRMLLLATLLPGAALAQNPAAPAPRREPRPPQRPRPEAPRTGQAVAEPAPAVAAQAPAATPEPAPPALNDPPVQLAPGLSALPNGGWRLHFAAGPTAIPPAEAASLREIAIRLRERSTGRVTLFGEASSGTDLSATRRLSLERARAVKAVLEQAGLDPTRVDIRALGRTPLAADLVDILPPAVARP